MLKTKYGDFDGNTWEEFCQACLKSKYEKEGYQELPAWQGDMGIEGFTRTGLVFQCYCPDEEYTPSVLYEKQRDKITTDLNKIKSREKELKAYLGNIKIEKWYFLTPIIKNKELIKHCTTKADEYRKEKLEILSDNFDVLVYDADLFLEQIPLIFQNLNSRKLEIQNEEIIEDNDIVEWKEQSINLVDNAIRKNNLRLPSDARNKESKVNKFTNNTIENFLDGNSIIQKWAEAYQSDYEKFQRIVGVFEKEVEERCMTNTQDNDILYNEIRSDLKVKLNQNFSYLADLTIDRLANRVMADWILRCPIDFE
jgi:hypothetical protein